MDDNNIDVSKIITNEIEDMFGKKEKGQVTYTEEDYQRLQNALVRYKGGDETASTEIVSMFHQFLSKYTKFIVYENSIIPSSVSRGNKKNLDPSLSKFVSLFIDKQKTTNSKSAFATACITIKKLFSKYDYWDIYNTLVLALLNMATKYKITKEGDWNHHKNGSFHMYVSRCFHWEAWRFLNKISNDPLVHTDCLHLCNFDKPESEEEKFYVYGIEDTNASFQLEASINEMDRIISLMNSSFLTLNESIPYSSYSMDSLNFNWTNGSTCSELFETLTPYEREILILSFVKNKTDTEISKIYGCHRTTINEHKKVAVNKLKEILKQKGYFTE